MGRLTLPFGPIMAFITTEKVIIMLIREYGPVSFQKEQKYLDTDVWIQTQTECFPMSTRLLVTAKNPSATGHVNYQPVPAMGQLILVIIG